jgi:hypothetical protein
MSPEAPKSTSAKLDLEAKKPESEAPEPTVEPTPALTVGQKVKHENGTTFIVAAVFADGIQLEGVANLVSRSALSLTK